MQSREEKYGLSKEVLRTLFRYEDGKLYRIASTWRSLENNCDWPCDNVGYLNIKISCKTYYIHRLIWIYHNGYIPVGLNIDHINRDRVDNHIENMRLVTPMQNSMNRSNNSSGIIGVGWNKLRGKWQARINVEGKTVSLGYFTDKECAGVARREAENRLGLR